MPYLVRENLFIGNISDAVEVLDNKEEGKSSEITHVLSVLSSASVSFFTEWRSSVVIPAKEIGLVGLSGGKLCLKHRHLLYVIKAMLGDYDAIHVRRGDILKTRKDRFGVERSLHPHVERDTRPEFILRRIAKWVPPGRTLYIASNERTPGFFSPLGVSYKLAYSSNYSSILDPVIENNYQLFMIERLIMMGAKTFINTFKTDDSELSLTDDTKKNTKVWEKVVRTKEDEESS